MADDDVVKYINDKKKYIEDDYKIRYFFDFNFLETNRLIISNYGTNCEKLDTKIDEHKYDRSPHKMKKFLNTNPNKNAFRPATIIFGVASIDGPFNYDNFVFKDESTTASREEKDKNFLDAFEALVANKKFFPKKSLIILNQDKHHMSRAKRRTPPLPTSAKKRLRAAENIRPITDYFKSTKSSSDCTQKKAERPSFNYRVEEILYDQRPDDDIKILWMPSSHSELDPMAYTSVFCKSEICRFMKDNKEQTTLTAIKQSFKLLPIVVWQKCTDLIKNYEDIYIERSERDEEDEEYDQDEKDESDQEEPDASAIEQNDSNDSQ